MTGPADIDAVQSSFAREGYVADRELSTSIFLALALGRPLLLEGEAGVGKTEVARTLRGHSGRRTDPAPVLRRAGRQHRSLRVGLPPADAGDPAAGGAG